MADGHLDLSPGHTAPMAPAASEEARMVSVLFDGGGMAVIATGHQLFAAFFTLPAQPDLLQKSFPKFRLLPALSIVDLHQQEYDY